MGRMGSKNEGMGRGKPDKVNRATAAECIACGQFEGVCPQHLPIIELLKDASAKLDS